MKINTLKGLFSDLLHFDSTSLALVINLAVNFNSKLANLLLNLIKIKF